MNGAPRNPNPDRNPNPFAPNGDDLDAVLGRFKDWTASMRPSPATAAANFSAAAGMSVASRAARLLGEAREISYEQALRASQFRRPFHIDNDLGDLDPLLPDRSQGKSKNDQSKDGQSTSNQSKPRQSNRDNAAEATPISPNLRSEGPPHFEIEADTWTPTALDRLQPAGSAPAKPAKPKPARRPGSNRKRNPSGQPAFRDVLQGTAALAAASRPGFAPPERGKATALTVRVSDSEQARIQSCAARANLSVSAYLRQCALGVDELRSQVEMALANLENQQAHPLPQQRLTSGPDSPPGLLRRFAASCLRRWQGSSSDYTGVSLR